MEPKDTIGLFLQLSRLIENKKLIQKIGKNGQKYIQKFTWKESAKKLEKIFKKFLIKEKVYE